VKSRLWALGSAAALAVSALALDASAALPIRASKFAWDKVGVLRGSFSFREALDDKAIAKKLANGLEVKLVMRGYVYPNAGGDPIALTAHTCSVAYDLWNEVFLVSVNGAKSKPVVNKKGVYRLCTDLVDHPIADRPTLRNKPSDYYLAVKVEVNPVGADTLKKVQQWVTRSTGASGSISPSDALFASFVGVFMKKIATADLVIDFQTDSFPP
jgi:hypothetical protein